MAKYTPQVNVRLSDPDAERVRRVHDVQIKELQDAPALALVLIDGVTLTDAVSTPIAHGLGRKPRMVIVSPPVGPSTSGRIEIVSTDNQFVYLKATGWGATITVTVECK